MKTELLVLVLVGATFVIASCSESDSSLLSLNETVQAVSTDVVLTTDSHDSASSRSESPVRVQHKPLTTQDRAWISSIEEEFIRGSSEKVIDENAFSNTNELVRSVIDELEALTPSERVSITISLEDPDFDFTKFQGASVNTRKELITQRKAQVQASQRRAIQRIEEIGGNVVASQWLVNQINVEIPSKAAGQLKEIPRLTGIYLPQPLYEELDNWGGAEIRSAMMIDDANLQNNKADFYEGCGSTNVPCYNGSMKPSSIGIIEPSSMMHPNHVGYSTGGPSGLNFRRALYTWVCASGHCTPDFGSGVPAGANHASTVAWCAAGSIENGEDPNFPGFRTFQQRQRSGIAGGSWIVGFLISTTEDIYAALEMAISQGIDVLNMSFGAGVCSEVNTRTYNPSNLNAQFENASKAGVLLVTSAGNGGHEASDCTITYPAWRPEVLAIGALDTYQTPANTKLVDTGLSETSSRGGASMRMSGGNVSNFSGIALTAPGCVQYDFIDDADGYNTSVKRNCGTSFAAPLVAGTAVIFREALLDLGWTATANSARRTLTNLLLLGNGWDAESDSKKQFGVSPTSGYGDVLAHYPSSRNLTAPWKWSSLVESISSGNMVAITISDVPLSSSVSQLKIVTTSYEHDLNAQPWYWTSVIDTCNNNALLSLDISTYPRKRFLLTNLEGRCPELRLTPYQVSSNGASLAVAFYYHSGDANYQH